MNVIATITSPTDTTPKRARRWLPGILHASFWVTEDPNPEYTRLDHLDGLGRTA